MKFHNATPREAAHIASLKPGEEVVLVSVLEKIPVPPPDEGWRAVRPYDHAEEVRILEDYTFWERCESERPQKGETASHRGDPEAYARYLDRIEHDGEDYIKYLADASVRSLGDWDYPHPIYEACIGAFGGVHPAKSMPPDFSRSTITVISCEAKMAGFYAFPPAYAGHDMTVANWCGEHDVTITDMLWITRARKQ